MLIALLTALTWVSAAQAAPCCAGSSATPTLISGDDFAQLSLGASVGFTIGDETGEGIPVFRSSRESEITQIYRLEGAILLSDRWQAGASLPIIARTFAQPGVSIGA